MLMRMMRKTKLQPIAWIKQWENNDALEVSGIRENEKKCSLAVLYYDNTYTPTLGLNNLLKRNKPKKLSSMSHLF